MKTRKTYICLLTVLSLIAWNRIAFAQHSEKGYSFPYALKGVSSNANIEAAEHPEFAFLLPEMAGNLNFGIILGRENKWMSETKSQRVTKKGNRLIYIVSDPILGSGSLTFTAIPLKTSDGIVLEISGERLPENVELFWTYGGGYAKVLDKTAPRTLHPEYCLNNVFSVEQSAFTMYFGLTVDLKVVMAVTPIGSEIRLSDANEQSSPLLMFESGKKTLNPALAAKLVLSTGKKEYFCVYRQNAKADYNHFMIPALFNQLNEEPITR